MKLQRTVPLMVLAGILILCFVGLSLDPARIPSPLLGQPLPQRSLPVLSDPSQTVATSLLTGAEPVMLNVFASWCTACVHEHPLLMEIAVSGELAIYGLNYKDRSKDASNWLSQRGNPYTTVLLDSDGSYGRSIGVYGVPESFVLNADGIIVYKHTGPLTRQVWLEDIMPLLAVRKVQ